MLNYEDLDRLKYLLNNPRRKHSMSPMIINDGYTTNNPYPQYQNYLNPINCINNPSYQYPDYFTNYNTSNNFHINASKQNIFYGKNNQKYNEYLYPEDNNLQKQNKYYVDKFEKNLSKQLLNEAKEKLRSVSNENKLIKRKRNNYVKLDIINCETQYPIMTCLNADPYNKLKRKSFIQNYNNINNYIINSSSKNNNETNDEKLNSIKNDGINNISIKNKKLFKGINNSCYNFGIKDDNKNTENINYSGNKNNESFKENTNSYLKINNTNIKSKIKDSIHNKDYNLEEKLSKTIKCTNYNKYIKDSNLIENKYSKDSTKNQKFIEKIKTFIGSIEQFFISSFHKLYHYFLSQMLLFIKDKIYENKNLLLQRFQRIRNNKNKESLTSNYTPDKIRKLEINYNLIKKVYIPKKHFQNNKQQKKIINNINIITSNNNPKTNTIKYLNTDYREHINEKTFNKRMIAENNYSNEKSIRIGVRYNKNNSQDNLIRKNKNSPNILYNNKLKFLLKSNMKKNNNNQNKIIYTKKRTNKFNINKKYISDEILNNNLYFNTNNNFTNYNNISSINNKNNLNFNTNNNQLSFINLYGVRSPLNMKYKSNERYSNDEYNYYEQEENDDTIEQTIIKDICTYDKKFSVFIKYVTSQRYEQNYLRLKLLKHKNLYLNNNLNYIGITHTDSITLLAIYTNLKMPINEISEEKESVGFSNIQDDENSINKIFNLVNVIEYYYRRNIIFFYNLFFKSLKYLTDTDITNSKGRNMYNNDITKSKSYYNWKKKDILINKDIDIRKKMINIDLINNIFKKSNSVKDINKEIITKEESQLDDIQSKINIFEKVLYIFRIKLLNFAVKQQKSNAS